MIYPAAIVKADAKTSINKLRSKRMSLSVLSYAKI
jgi:hypothetical protein